MIDKEVLNKKNEDKSCQCTFCTVYPYLKWATVMECKCGCHIGDGITEHDSLCCSLPNVLKKNNPYKNLENSEVYRKKITDYFGDEI